MKQSSLNDELLSIERHEANAQVRQRVRKQQSLDERPAAARSLKESLLAVTKSKQFESLRAGWSILRSAKKSFEDLNEEDEDLEKKKEEEEEEMRKKKEKEEKEEKEKKDAESIKGRQDSPGGPQRPSMAATATVTSLGSGFVRIWQSWSSRSGAARIGRLSSIRRPGSVGNRH